MFRMDVGLYVMAVLVSLHKLYVPWGTRNSDQSSFERAAAEVAVHALTFALQPSRNCCTHL